MFEKLQMAPPDPILGLSEAFKKDPHPHKINLSVGVYQDADGKTPILDVVKEAEQTPAGGGDEQGLPGHRRAARIRASRARDAVRRRSRDHAAAARRDGADARRHRRAARGGRLLPAETQGPAHLGQQSHVGQSSAASSKRPGCRSTTYPYLDARPAPGWTLPRCRPRCRRSRPATPSASTRRATIRPALIRRSNSGDRSARCCSSVRSCRWSISPTRASPKAIDEDRAGLLQLADICPEMLVCSSFSKNFGLYGERVGALTLVAPTEEAAQIGLSHIKICIRTNYSNPPKHGGAIVATMLSESRSAREVARRRPVHARPDRRHAAAVCRHAASQRRARRTSRSSRASAACFRFPGSQPEQVDKLRSDYGIYIVRSGRINVAGMTEANMDRLCDAIKSVL